MTATPDTPRAALEQEVADIIDGLRFDNTEGRAAMAAARVIVDVCARALSLPPTQEDGGAIGVLRGIAEADSGGAGFAARAYLCGYDTRQARLSSPPTQEGEQGLVLLRELSSHTFGLCCPYCIMRDREHAADCLWVRVRAYLAAPTPTQESEK